MIRKKRQAFKIYTQIATPKKKGGVIGFVHDTVHYMVTLIVTLFGKCASQHINI